MTRGRPAVRLASGAVFVIAGLAKFVVRGAEVRAFERFGLPEPGLFASFIGVAEAAGGLALLLDVWSRWAAAGLAMIMVGAIVISGIVQGDVVPSLTLAPLLLAAMTYLLVSDP